MRITALILGILAGLSGLVVAQYSHMAAGVAGFFGGRFFGTNEGAVFLPAADGETFGNWASAKRSDYFRVFTHWKRTCLVCFGTTLRLRHPH